MFFWQPSAASSSVSGARPTSACNAAEQLLVHRDIAATALPRLAKALQAARTGGVELRCDTASAAILVAAGIETKPATAEDYRTEFLDYVLCVRVVDSLDAAIAEGATWVRIGTALFGARDYPSA